ncbi:hypothetical protein HNQ80_005079 [Anaerosolibacter carboniphilus]|uniref:Uncharacterized protein n=1 Tax=Anaerosolibacter carboniphilus TaxID=1417629 RepID=A0A841KZ54_9FIRM|nr:hypothetical protein [Anaerosolibacter carboniphilus]
MKYSTVEIFQKFKSSYRTIKGLWLKRYTSAKALSIYIEVIILYLRIITKTFRKGGTAHG